MEIAQATDMPPSGGSNAFDFQPQTRNPQAGAVPTQPQTGNLQTPATTEVLGRQDVRIIVPTGTASTTDYRPTTKGDGVGDLVAIIVLGVVIAAIISFLFQRRKQTSRSLPAAAPAKEESTAKPTPAPKKTRPAQKKSKPKHKRKKRK